MTRDEAIKLLWIEKNLCHSGGHSEAKNLVDKLSALGVLNLDEPKNTEERLQYLAKLHCGEDGPRFLRKLFEAGFKVVETKSIVS